MLAAFFQNWDLFILGVVVIVVALLGFMVYFENPRSLTRKSFLGFTLWTAVWGTFNYLSYHVQPPLLAFYFLRITIFAVIWETYYFLKFAFVFPLEEGKLSAKFWWIVQGIACGVAVLTLTPFVFKDIGSVSSSGTITQVVNGPAIPLFGMTSVGLTIAGVILLLRKTLGSGARSSYRLISIGVLVMFGLIITSNFIFPVFLSNARYIQFGGLFVFPFVVLTSYAIIKSKVFNVKVVSTGLFIAVLLLLSLFQIIQSRTLPEVILRTAILLCLLAIGILLVKSVRKEVEQREELERLTKELTRANTQLEELSRFKTQLLSLASHQIKSPLAAIKGFISILLEGLYGPVSEKVAETLRKMKVSTDGLISLINMLLDLRRVEEGKLEYKFAKTDIAALVRGVVEELRLLASEKQLKLIFSYEGDPVFVNADAQKLKQVIQNLVDNAIKYTPKGFVRVSLKEEEGQIEISVVDSGLGIPADLLPHLFEEFVRDERVKKEILGTGFGLYIARKIIEAHNGTVTAESEGERKGSIFTVRLKRA